MTELILLVDDDDSILQLVKMYVEREGFRASVARDGNLAYELIRQDAPALVVLDVMLPGMDGFALCSKLRALGYQVPIIMLTARDEDIDKILGLELGADDYLTKPFNPRELTARIKAILRRRERALVASSPLRIGDLLIDPASREVRCRNAVLDLRTQEFDLLLTLAENKGKVLSREQLLEKAWGFDFYGQTRTVDVHVVQLRRKLSTSGIQIETVTGVGYKLVG